MRFVIDIDDVMVERMVESNKEAGKQDLVESAFELILRSRALLFAGHMYGRLSKDKAFLEQIDQQEGRCNLALSVISDVGRVARKLVNEACEE